MDNSDFLKSLKDYAQRQRTSPEMADALQNNDRQIAALNQSTAQLAKVTAEVNQLNDAISDLTTVALPTLTAAGKVLADVKIELSEDTKDNIYNNSLGVAEAVKNDIRKFSKDAGQTVRADVKKELKDFVSVFIAYCNKRLTEGKTDFDASVKSTYSKCHTDLETQLNRYANRVSAMTAGIYIPIWIFIGALLVVVVFAIFFGVTWHALLSVGDTEILNKTLSMLQSSTSLSTHAQELAFNLQFIVTLKSSMWWLFACLILSIAIPTGIHLKFRNKR